MTFFKGNIPSSYRKANYLQLMDVYFKDPQKNYYELDSKLLLDNGIKQSLFIRYINHNSLFPKPIASIIYMEYQNNRWEIKDIGENFELGLFLCCIQTERLNSIITANVNNSIVDILKSLKKNDEIDLQGLIDMFFSLKKSDSNHPLVKFLYDTTYSIF